MKIQFTPPLKNFNLWLIFPILCLFLVLGSCKKERNVPYEEPVDLSTVKQWFTNNSTATLSKDNWLNSFSPNWDKVQLETTDEKVNIYQIELHNPDRIFAISQDFD